MSMIRLREQTRLWLGGVAHGGMWIGGQRVWAKSAVPTIPKLSDFYGTGIGQILIDARLSERAVNGSNTVTSVPVLGGEAAQYALVPYNINGTPLPTGFDKGVNFAGNLDALQFGSILDLRGKHILIAFHKAGSSTQGLILSSLTHAIRLVASGSQSIIRVAAASNIDSGLLTLADGWHLLEFRLAGNRAQAWLNGEKVIDAAADMTAGWPVQYLGHRNQTTGTLQYNSALGDLVAVHAADAVTEYPAATLARSLLLEAYGLIPDEEPPVDDTSIDLARMTTLTPQTRTLLDSAAAAGQVAPYPAWAAQQTWTPPVEWFQTVSWTSTAGDGFHVIDSPYRPADQFVHPRIMYFPGGWNGWLWIMSINPYASEAEENPCLYGSNDLKNFTLLSDWAPMPLDTPVRAFLSDVGLTFDPVTGEVVCFWRGVTVPTGSTLDQSIYERRTVDGRTWTLKERVFDGNQNGAPTARCPSLVYNAAEGRWWLFASDNTSLRAWVSQTRKNGTWTEIPLTGAPTEWHVDVQLVGNRLLGLGGHNVTTRGGLKASYSAEGDWSQWTSRTGDALNTAALNSKYSVGAIIPYKVSVAPIAKPNGSIETVLVWSTLTSLGGAPWRVFTTRSAPYPL